MSDADLLGHTESEVAVVYKYCAVANLDLQFVERSRGRTRQHGTGLDVELTPMAGTSEGLQLLVVVVAAAKVGAVSIVGLELGTVFGVEPHRILGPSFDPCITLVLDEIDADGHADVELRDVFRHLDPGGGLRLRHRRRDERTDHRDADQHAADHRTDSANPSQEAPAAQEWFGGNRRGLVGTLGRHGITAHRVDLRTRVATMLP